MVRPRAIILTRADSPAWLARRTHRSLTQASCEVGEWDTLGDVWLVTEGAWTRRSSITIPSFDAAIVLVGAVPSDPAWAAALRRSGGVFTQSILLPTVLSVALNQAARLALGKDTPTDLTQLCAKALRMGLRLIRHAALDVAYSPRLRVLEVITSLQRGGAERMVLDLHEQLQRQGVESCLCVLGTPTRAAFDSPPGAISLAHLPAESAARAAAVAVIAHEQGCDVLHLHLVQPAIIEALAQQDWPVLTTIHNERAGWPLGLLEARLPASAMLVACSQAVERDLRQALPAAWTRTAWNGIRVHDYEHPQRTRLAERTRLGIAAEDLVLVAVANPRPQKRMSLLADIHQELCMRIAPRKVWLLLAGEPSVLDPAASAELAAFHARAATQGVQQLGAVADVASLLGACDVLVSSSAHEGLSLAQLEALAAGLRVVATDVGGAREVSARHDALLLVPADAAPAQFVEAILRPVQPSERSLADFTWAAMAERYRWLFHAMLMKQRLATQPGSGLVLVANNLSTGGAQSSARRLLLELQAMGERVQVVLIQEHADHPTPGREVLLSAGINVFCAAPPDLCEPLNALLPVLDFIARCAPRAVMFWNVIAQHKVLLADAMQGLPVFDVSPGEMYFSSLERYFAQPRPGLPYRTAQEYGQRLAGVIVKHTQEIEAARATLGCPIHCIANGVTLPMTPARREPHASGFITIGTAARLNPHKRLEDLIDAFRLVHAQRAEARLLIAGGEEEWLADYAIALRQRAADLPITWLGNVRDITALHAQLDVFAMISEPVGCPNASLEAMANGLPVVATAVGGAVDQIEHGVSGWLTPPRDAAALAGVLLWLCDDAATRIRMGDAARLRIAQCFTLRHMAERYREVVLG